MDKSWNYKNKNKHIKRGLSLCKRENEFLKNHQDLSNRIIVVNDVNNDTILEGLQDIMNAPTGNSPQESSFGLPLAIGLVVGALIGVGCGIFIMRKKN